MVYWDIVRFAFLRFFSYPFEILAMVIKRVVEIVFLIIFWSIVAKTTNQQISVLQISAYFLIALGVADITMSRWGALSYLTGNMIKTGQISNYIIKPTNLIWTLYAIAIGRNGLRNVLAVLNIVIGIVIYPPKNLLGMIMFLIFLALSWVISFSYNLFEGVLFMHFDDAWGIRNSLQNTIRVFSGSMVPIYLFPSPLKEIVSLLPFPAMIYGPTNALNATSINGEVVKNFWVALFWAVVITVSVRKWWHYSMKKYEAVGI